MGPQRSMHLCYWEDNVLFRFQWRIIHLCEVWVKICKNWRCFRCSQCSKGAKRCWITGLIDWYHHSTGSASQMLLPPHLGCLTQFLSETGFLWYSHLLSWDEGMNSPEGQVDIICLPLSTSVFYQVGLWALGEAFLRLDERGKARGKRGWGADKYSPSLPLRKQSANMSFMSLWNQLTTCFHPLMDMPHYGGCKPVLLTSAMLLCVSSKDRISIEAYKCPALVTNSPQKCESMVQLPVPTTYPCPRASLEPCKCQS